MGRAFKLERNLAKSTSENGTEGLVKMAASRGQSAAPASARFCLSPPVRVGLRLHKSGLGVPSVNGPRFFRSLIEACHTRRVLRAVSTQ